LELSNQSKQPVFPLDIIREEFKANPAKNLSFDDDFIERLLTTQKDASECFSVLSLIYSHLNFGNQEYHKDHLHPESYFKNCKRSDFQTDEEYKFYIDPLNWNSILNLQLLNGTLNQSKLDTPLKIWVEKNKIDKGHQLIPDVNLDITDFKSFLAERKNMLVEHLKKMV